jgi:hypothetical protein
MQVFPNFTSATVRGGVAAPIQTVAQTYTISQNDVSNGYAQIPITWDTPFADSNYVVSLAVETAQGMVANSVQPALIKSKTASGFTANVNLVAADLGTGGSVITIHAVAFHL